jgi:hypothetical protein
LDASQELSEGAPGYGGEQTTGEFIESSVDTLLALGVPMWGAFEVTGNSMVESARGQKFRGWNLGGVKVKESDAEWARAAGLPLRWFRAPGNKAVGATLEDLAGGDPPWCFYRVWDSMLAFYSDWLWKYVPADGAVDRTRVPRDVKRYKATGKAFWGQSDSWFLELCRAGYKGQNTQKSPERSVLAHRELAKEAMLVWAQAKLGVAADGVWGMGSQKACATFQKESGMNGTGFPGKVTLERLNEAAMRDGKRKVR